MFGDGVYSTLGGDWQPDRNKSPKPGIEFVYIIQHEMSTWEAVHLIQ